MGTVRSKPARSSPNFLICRVYVFFFSLLVFLVLEKRAGGVFFFFFPFLPSPREHPLTTHSSAYLQLAEKACQGTRYSVYMTRPICRSILHKTLCRMLALLVKAGLSATRRLKKRRQNTRRSRVTAPADLEPPKVLGFGFGFGLGLGSGLGLGWSGPSSKVEI